MTSAAKHFGKRLQDFLDNKATLEYIGALRTIHADEREFTQAKVGYNGGTWAHPKLAVFFARWLDVRFSVWCDSVIDELLRGKAAVVPTRPVPAPAPVDAHRKACLDEFRAQTQLLQGLYAVARTQAADISRLMHEVGRLKKRHESPLSVPISRPPTSAPAPTSARLASH